MRFSIKKKNPKLIGCKNASESQYYKLENFLDKDAKCNVEVAPLSSKTTRKCV